MAASSSTTKRKSSKGSGGENSLSNKKSKPTSSSSSTYQQDSKKDRQSHRRHADIVDEGKRIWNQLRLKGNTTQQTRALMQELMPLITGKAHEIALQHDASRVVQAAIQFGNASERRQIVQELVSAAAVNSNSSSSSSSKNNNNNVIVELCKSQYAHFVVLKIIKYCHSDAECMKLLTSKLRGHMAKLAVHATASRVVESLFETCANSNSKSNKELLATLKLEFYGPHFALFAPDTLQRLQGKMPTLSANLTIHPEKKDVTLDFVKQLVHKGLEKQLYGFLYFQTLLLEYLEQCRADHNYAELRAAAAQAADQALHLLSARAGTHVVALLVSYGTAKDRKRIVKSLKGYARSGLLHRDAYLAVLRLVQLTDDTVSIQKNIFNELVSRGPGPSTIQQQNSETNNKDDDDNNNADSPLLEIALSDTGSKLFLMLLVDECTEVWNKMLDPYEHSVLFANPTITEENNGNKQAVPTSKKDATVRRKELLKPMREPLLELCRQHADVLLRSIPGAAVLKQVYVTLQPSSEVVEAVLNVCDASVENNDTEDGDEEEEEEAAATSIFEDVIGHRAIKNLILCDIAAAEKEKKQAVSDDCFSAQFLERWESRLMPVVAQSNRGAFVVASLGKVPGLHGRVKKALDKSQIQKMSKSKEGPTAGFAALLKEI